jgi:hypothetical protein
MVDRAGTAGLGGEQVKKKGRSKGERPEADVRVLEESCYACVIAGRVTGYRGQQQTRQHAAQERGVAATAAAVERTAMGVT